MSAGALDVGVICSTTGRFADHGAAFLDGLRQGVEGDAGAVALHVRDDRSDITAAVEAAERLIADGCRLLVSSGPSPLLGELAGLAERRDVVVIAGTATSDHLSGRHRFVFRAGRQLAQESLAVGAWLADRPNRNVAVVARPTVVGDNAAAAAASVLGALGHAVELALVDGPLAETVDAVARAQPDVVVLAWDGPERAELARAAALAGLPEVAVVLTDLWRPAELAELPPAARLVVHDGAAGDGFVAGRMAIRAATAGDGTAHGISAALEGWSFDAPRGRQTIRAGDHAMQQPMAIGRVADGGEIEIVTRFSADELAAIEPPRPGWTARGLHHVGLAVHDLERSMRFYVEALGGRLIHAPVTIPAPDASGPFEGPPTQHFRFATVAIGATAGVELFEFRDPEIVPVRRYHPHFAVEVDETPAALERIVALGGTRVWPEMGGFGRARTWFVADPDGNVFELLDGSGEVVAVGAHELFPDSNPTVAT
jgi:branched-chain amino acid transport system substrate-binding protein